jgi:hypothetical protein
MKTIEREYLAQAYASAWRTVKRDKTTVLVLDNGWFQIQYAHGIPATKCRAEKLLKGLAVLVGRLEQMREAPKNMGELLESHK